MVVLLDGEDVCRVKFRTSYCYRTMLITSSWLVDTILVIVTTFYLLYKYVTRNFDYWKDKGVVFLKPLPFVGNFQGVMTFRSPIGEWMQDFYDSSDEPFYGIFGVDKPYLIVKSPELIKQILIKDVNYFKDRIILAPEHDLLFSNMLFNQKSPEWKKVRSKMNTAFTSGKVKGMFPIINKIAEDLSKQCGGQVEVKELCAKYTTEVIAQCAFGIEANCLHDDEAEFRKVGKAMVDMRWRNAIIQSAYFFVPDLIKLFKPHYFEQYIIKFLSDAVWDAIKTREETKTFRNDLIDVLIEIKNNKEMRKELKFEGDRVVAQPINLFVAGFETTSSAIAFALHELSINPDIQTRLRKEIKDTIEEYKGLTYEGLAKMEYLDICIKEALRKYPSLPFLDRRCNEDYQIPGTTTVIEKGTGVLIPIIGLHYDEKYFPEPEKYDPDRFLNKTVCNVDGLNYLPFGDGPRHCIGKIFGLLSVKLALVNILNDFELIKSSATQIPMVYSAGSIVLLPKDGLYITFKKIEQ